MIYYLLAGELSSFDDDEVYMNIVITTLNSKYIHSSLALRYLKSYGRTKNQAYEIVEYTINMPILDIISSITEKNAHIIGFACYIWNIEMTLHVAHILKSIDPSIKIVLGGPEVSYNAKELLEDHSYIDYIVQGEGEEAFAALTERLQNHKSALYPEIPGIIGREAGVLGGPVGVVEVKDLSTIPFPYTEEDMVDLENKIMYYESSRGCPFSCQYCLSGNGNTVRFFPQQRTLEELSWFVKHGVKQIKFVDRTFNCAPHHHIPLMEWMVSQECITNFHLEMESILMGPKEVELLSTAPKGRIQIEVGVQSTHDKTLQAIRRRNDWNHIVEVMTPVIEAGNTHVHMDLIVGLPHETKERFTKSFNDLFSLVPHALQIGFLKLLKGSGVRNMKEYEYVADPKAPYEVLKNHVMTYEEIRFLKHFEDVFERYYNSERYRTVFTYLSKRIIDTKENAFAYFEHMVHAWLAKGNHERKLNDKDQISFLYEFFSSQDDVVAIDLLRYDVLCSYKGKIKGEEIGLPKDRKEELQGNEYFWRNEELVKQYIPNYEFKEWRRIRQDYYELLLERETLEFLSIKVHSHDKVNHDIDVKIPVIIDVTRQVRPFVRPRMESL